MSCESIPAKVHFGTFTAKNGKIYGLAPVLHFDPNFAFWLMDVILVHTFLIGPLTTFEMHLSI